MSGATFDFKLKSNRKEVLRGSEEAVERGLAAIGMRAVTYTHRPKERGGTDAPSGGGADDRTVIIGTNVEYGETVEEGTSKRKPAHMLRNALTDGADEYARIMEAALKAT